MNSLLKRQIEKHLNSSQLKEMASFLNAINDSYINYEDQLAMQHRAMKISSEELFNANQKLREEALLQKEINTNLESILDSMEFQITSLPNQEKQEVSKVIKDQSIEIIKISKQRALLLANLEKQNLALNEYAHMVSHDLKAPLRSIDALLNWYIEDNAKTLTNEDFTILNKVISNVEKMDLLIKGILDYSSIDIDVSEHRNIDFNDIIAEVINIIHLPNHVNINVNGKLPTLSGNSFKFKQLFQNLIQNAIKYNDKEICEINIGFNEAEKSYTFYVADNGKGIDSKYFEKIFNVFSKLESNTDSSGIGLSIVKKIVESHQGTVWLESEEQVGTTFYFTLFK